MAAFETHRAPALPPLAWHYSCRRRELAQLTVGSGVDVHDTGFFEGAFAGPWPPVNLDRRPNVFGSGMCLRDNVPWFVGPSHTLEALFVCRSDEGFAVSNSLAFLVEANQIALPHDPDYARRLATVVRGFDDYEPLLAEGRGWRIERVVFDNFAIDDRGVVVKRRKPPDPAFATFEDYCALLRSVLRDTFANAAETGRVRTFVPLGSCSSGYDSLAATVLALDLGISEAITIRSARGGRNDSGAASAERLGLKAVEVERTARVSLAELSEFAATGMGSEDVALMGFEPHLAGRVLLTGCHGDKIWTRHTSPEGSMSRGDLAGAGLQEFRLRVGFVHLPVPMVLSRQLSRIAAIAELDEMAPFSIGGTYDRPIPRRLIETAGVPRGTFGTRKEAVSTLVFADRRLVTDDSRGEPELLRAAAWTARAWLIRALMKLWGHSSRASRMAGDWRIVEHAHPRNSRLFRSSVEALRRRYANDVSASGAARTS